MKYSFNIFFVHTILNVCFSPEDNDYLVSILDRSAPILKQTYGEFYIAEMILATPSDRKIIVAETVKDIDYILYERTHNHFYRETKNMRE